VSRKIVPNSARNTSMIAALAAEKRGLRKKRRSSIGLDDFSSHTKNPARSTAPTPKPVRISDEVHPWLGASMIAHSSAPRLTIDSAAPTGSRRGVVLSYESGTRK
jgi:hypothetical protein